MAVENQTLAPFFADGRNPFNYAKIEQINRDLVTSWLTLDEITQQLNLFGDESQDSYLTSLELATRMAIEDYLGFAIFTTQYRTYYPDQGYNGTSIYFDLPEATPSTQFGGGLSVDAVYYYTGQNTATKNLLASSNYFFDPTGNRVVVYQGMPEPLAQNVANPVVIEFTLNSNFAAQFPVIKQAGLMLLTHLYNNRTTISERQLVEIPWGVQTLLRPYKPLVM